MSFRFQERNFKLKYMLTKGTMDSSKYMPPKHMSVSYVMRNQIKLFIGERSKTTFDSGCKIFDLFLSEPHQVGLYLRKF